MRGEAEEPWVALNGDWVVEDELGGFSTRLPLAFWRGRRGFDAVGIGAWLIMVAEASKKSSWKIWSGSEVETRLLSHCGRVQRSRRFVDVPQDGQRMNG